MDQGHVESQNKMKMSIQLKSLAAILLPVFISCNGKEKGFDASGNFEADEVIVSAQQSGQLLTFNVHEGDTFREGDVVGQIDVTVQQLQKEQTEASIASLGKKTGTASDEILSVKKQLDVLASQLKYLEKERQRTRNLVEGDALPRKKLDDINAQIDQLEKQMAATRSQINVYTSRTATQNRSILSEQAPLEKQASQIQAQINKGRVVNPINGTVLTSYALKGEMATIGKPLYKIANTDTIYLKAWITGNQLAGIKPGQAVTVRIDSGNKNFKTYPGTISWISSKSEFTPKTIQTRDERSNLVYAIKVRVKNDGYLKIGMYGEVLFDQRK